jgi:hypothetical protein
MPIENSPQEPEDIIVIAAKAEYLKINTELGEIKLEAHDRVNIQPDGTIFGTKIKVEENRNITPTLTFDTKKMRGPKKKIDAKQMLNDALEDFLNEQV